MSLRGLQNHAGAGIGGLALGIGVVWIAFKALGNGLSTSGDFPQFIVVTLNGLTIAGLYFIVASGFTLIFGLMRIVNMAYGSLYLLGGYIAFSLQEDFSGAAGARPPASAAARSRWGVAAPARARRASRWPRSASRSTRSSCAGTRARNSGRR